MKKNWLKNYPTHVPAEINPDSYQSIIEVLDLSVQKFPDHPAFYNLGTTLTYKQVAEYSYQFAAYLQQVLKATKGDRIAIMLPNILQYPLAMMGAMRAGLIIVNVNPLYTADELALQLTDSGATTIIVMENFARTVQSVLKQVPMLKNIIITKIGDLFSAPKAWATHFILKYVKKNIPRYQLPHATSFKKILYEGKKCIFSPVTLTNNDIAFLQYTGGTTGVAKAAVLTHRNIIANLQQVSSCYQNILTEGEEIIISALPFYHIYSLVVNYLFFNKMGALNILITNPRDVDGMVTVMKKFKFSAITGVNTLFNALLKNPNFAKLDFSKLRISNAGGMAVQQATAQNWLSITGVPLQEGYGLTEASPCVTFNPTARFGTVGFPLPSTDVRIFDDNDNELPYGQVGELVVKGPQIMHSYWQSPIETKQVFTADNWLRTGDIATLDEQGFISILECKKDMILVSGFNVYPNEVENIITKHSGVREAAVIGVVDEKSGEAVKAFVVRETSKVLAEDLIEHCRKYLTAYKVPKHIEFCSELPKTNVGKILRRALRTVSIDENHGTTSEKN